MKNKTIKIKARRTWSGDYIIESIRGSAGFRLMHPPQCSDKNHCYHVGDTIRQEEADAMTYAYDVTVLCPTGLKI
jgi:hypothetical protein